MKNIKDFEKVERGARITLANCPASAREAVSTLFYSNQIIMELLESGYWKGKAMQGGKKTHEVELVYRLEGDVRGIILVDDNVERVLMPVVDIITNDRRFPTRFSVDGGFTYHHTEEIRVPEEGKADYIYYVGTVGSIASPDRCKVSFDPEWINQDGVLTCIVNGEHVLGKIVCYEQNKWPRRFGRFTVPNTEYEELLRFCRITSPEAAEYIGTEKEPFVMDVVTNRLFDYMVSHPDMSLNNVAELFRCRRNGDGSITTLHGKRLPHAEGEEGTINF